jgi:hypothetical protein
MTGNAKKNNWEYHVEPIQQIVPITILAGRITAIKVRKC